MYSICAIKHRFPDFFSAKETSECQHYTRSVVAPISIELLSGLKTTELSAIKQTRRATVVQFTPQKI